jgi:fructokinase
MNPTVLAFGEILWDILPSGKVLGGAPANVAFRLHERKILVGLVSRIGNDVLGAELKDALSQAGLSLSYLQEDNELPTGTVSVKINKDGNPRYQIHTDVAYDAIEATPALLEFARTAQVICYGTLAQRSTTSQGTLRAVLTAAQSAIKVCDINLRKDCYTNDTIREALEHAHVLKLNRSEVAPMADLTEVDSSSTSEFANQIFRKYPLLNTILITLGEDGVEAFSSSGSRVHVATTHVSVLDTIGSGDAFTAGFISGVLAGDSLEASCRRGNVLGALAATKRGGMGAISDYEVQSFASRLGIGSCVTGPASTLEITEAQTGVG